MSKQTYRPRHAKTLDGIEVDDMTATEAAERNLAVFVESGVRVERNWDRNAPYVKYNGPGEWWIPDQHIIDHAYRLCYPDGRVVYGSEPYGLTENDIFALSVLAAEGWRVWIGQMPLWYPGRTTQVLFERKKDAR